MKRCFQPVKSKLADDKYRGPGSHKSFVDDKEAAIQDYHKTSRKGPMAAKELKAYLDQLMGIESNIKANEVV